MIPPLWELMELKLNIVVVSQIFEVAIVTYNFQPTKLFFRFEKDLLYEMAQKCLLQDNCQLLTCQLRGLIINLEKGQITTVKKIV